MKQIKNALFAVTLASMVIAASNAFVSAADAQTVDNPDDKTAPHITPLEKDGKEQQPQVRHGHHGRRHILMKDASELLGMSEQELVKEWKQGKTLQQIAKEKKGWSADVFVQKLTAVQISKIDQAVKAGKMTKERAEQMKQKLPASLKRFTQHTYRPHQDRRAPGTYSHI